MITKTYNKTKKVCKTTFSLDKEAVTSAKKVALLGEFNDWNKEKAVEMKKSKDGSFQATVELPLGKKYEFRYLLDNGVWENDWKADDYVFISRYNVHNSVVKIDALPSSTTKKATKTTAKKTTKTTKAKATKTTNSRVKPTTKKADDLKKIEGIGPKIATLLKEAGIKTFADLSKAKIVTLQSVLDKAGPRFKMHNPKTWAKQAGLAAKGEWTKLEKLQKELNGGI